MQHNGLLITSVLWFSVAFAEPIPLEPVRGQVQLQDLANVAITLGIYFEIFDYELPEANCIHFYVEEIGSSRERRHDGGGVCELDGPMRLTVQWQLQAGALVFQFFQHRLDIKQGLRISGPIIPIQIPIGEYHTSGFRVPPPRLELGEETLLVHNKYGTGEDAIEVKVLAELRPNPDGNIGTE